MGRKKQESDNQVVLGSQMESGVQYVFEGWSKDGRSLWRIATPPPANVNSGAMEAAHRDWKRKGIPVQNKITKRLPGNYKPGKPKGGWRLGS